MKKPILLILAAGFGTRFGGLKQMAGIWKNEETLLDFSSFDALRENYSKIVFVIRHNFEEEFKKKIISKISKKIPCEMAFQEIDSLIPNTINIYERTKPWGTGHAVACAYENLDAPFVVINADFFYGRTALAMLGNHISNNNECAIVPYKLGDTISENGTVNRGLCNIENGYLTSVQEIYKIAKESDGKIYGKYKNGETIILQSDSFVSLNCWGFTESAKELFMNHWNNFISDFDNNKNSECLMQDAVMNGIKTGDIKMRALISDSKYIPFEMTYKDDQNMVADKISQMIKDGEYPDSLWG